AGAGEEVDAEVAEHAREMKEAVLFGDVHRRRDVVVDRADELHVIAFVGDVEVDEHAADVTVDRAARRMQPARRAARLRVRALVLELVRLPGEMQRQPRHLPPVDDCRLGSGGAAGDEEEHQRGGSHSPFFSDLFAIWAFSAARRSSRSFDFDISSSLRSTSMLLASSWRSAASSWSSSASASTASTLACRRSNASSAGEPIELTPLDARALALSVSLRSLTSVMRSSSCLSDAVSFSA